MRSLFGDPMMEVRTALTSTTNTTGSDSRTGIGGAEILKQIDKVIVDYVNRSVDFSTLVDRKNMDQLAYIWNIRLDLGSTDKAAFYSDGATGTPYPSTKIQYVATAKAMRSDYEVTGLMMAASASYYDALADEARDALSQLKIAENKAMLCGTDTASYGLANSYLGLLQLMGSNATFTDTDTVYGTARAAARNELDVSLVAAGATSQDALDLADLDNAIIQNERNGGKGDDRIFLCTPEREAELNRLLQPLQRFSGTLNLEGGFTISTYKGVPIVTDRFLDKSGITWNGTTKTLSATDAAMYLLDMDFVEFRVVNGVDATHVPILGDDTSIRKDVKGGYFKTYGVLVMRNFNRQVLIYNLSVP